MLDLERPKGTFLKRVPSDKPTQQGDESTYTCQCGNDVENTASPSPSLLIVIVHAYLEGDTGR